MEVLLESEEQMGRNKQKGRGKRQRPAGPPAPSPAVVADQTGRLLAEREREWLDRLTTDPASFAALQRTLTDVEDHLQNARRYYNAVVRDFNTAIARFPAVLVARLLGFAPREFFGLDDASEAAVPRVETS